MKIDKPEQVLAMQMLNTYMKSAIGSSDSENNNFDLIMEAIMDNITSNNTDKNVEDMLNSFTTGSTNNSLYNLDSPSDESSSDSNMSLDKLNYNYNNLIKNRISSSSSNGNSNPQIDAAILKASKQFGVDEALIRSIIQQESAYDSTAVSGAGAMGLMQLMPENCKAAGVTDPFNVDQNVYAGTKLLKTLLNTYNGNVEMALMAYNAGSGTMQRRGVSSINDLYKMPSETQDYVAKVMGNYRNNIV